MTETITPQEAARAVAAASRYEDALARRTEGLTWMVWGIATPAIFMTYAFASALGGRGWWMGLLWIPWVAAAVLTTAALWRSAALSQPAMRVDPGVSFWLRFAGFTAAITLVFYILNPRGPEIPLLVVGTMWAGMGVLNVWGSSPSGRWACVLAGAPLAISGAALALANAPIEVSGSVGFVVSGLAPLAVGAWRAFRG